MMRRSSASGGSGLAIRIIIGLVIAAFSLFSYFASQEYNPVVGENQHLSLTPEQEIALGLQSAPEMVQEFGGVYNDQQAQQLLDEVGSKLINSSPKVRELPWQFDFTVLADSQTVNAFALPGGPTFITVALLSRLQTEDQVAGVMAHEITHVLARHSAQQIAKSELTNGLLGAVTVASGDANAAQTAAMVAQLVNMKYGREAEIQSDTIGVCLMRNAGYDPNAMIEVMKILEQAGGGGGQPEWTSTHPSPENRIARIQEAIANAETGCTI
jgi:predicted Zn-dependent protease